MQYFIGIDPGVQGGMALINELGKPVMVEKIEGKTLTDIYETLQEMFGYVKTEGDSMHAMIEDISKGSPKGIMIVKCSTCGTSKKVFANMQKPSTAMVLGANFGAMQLSLIAAKIPWELAAIRDWQASLGVYGTKGTKTQKKNKHKAVAQQLFPDVKITHAIADALLIAEYCRRTLALRSKPPL